jgi:undecaprenyl phosphate N,N'-diacetylbacillosamine 1-phosphate transferase
MGKRLFDVVCSAIGLALCLPLFAVLAAWIRIDSPGPVFYTQTRLGRHGRFFRLFKFRTMTARPRNTMSDLVLCEAEITRLGRFLRRFKLDELPQLWNVLCGDMSVVGPRPALPAQLDELNEVGQKRLLVRPGLTGLAQVHGNVYLPWEERWKYDAEYVERLSFTLDCWIVWRTLLTIATGEERWKKLWTAERS